MATTPSNERSTPDAASDAMTAPAREQRTADARWIPRRFLLPCVAGAIVALVFLAFASTAETFDLTGATPARGGATASFYDAQAEAMRHGHFDVPIEAIDGEAFVIDGKNYGYWGPTPSLLRIPLLEVFPQAYGNLNALSMLTAFGVLVAFVCRLLWDVRRVVRGDAEVSRGEQWAVGVFVALLGTGTVLVYLAALTFPYHESIAWGAALAIATASYTLRFLLGPSASLVARMGVAAALAALSRPTTGFGAIGMIGLAFALCAFVTIVAFPRVRSRMGDERARRVAGRLQRVAGTNLEDASARRYVLPLLLALVVPVVLYVGVNEAKFGQAFGLPYEKHLGISGDSARRARLGSEGEYGPQFVPGNLVQLVRPDSLSTSDIFPWLEFRFPAHEAIFNPFDVSYDGIERHAGVLATMPALVVLAAIGVVLIARRRRDASDRRLAVLRIPLAGTAVGALLTLSFAGLTERYVGDLFPFLVIGGVTGLFAVYGWRPVRSSLKVAAICALVAAAVMSVVTNAALAVNYQYTANETPAEARVDFRIFQYRVANGDGPIPVKHARSASPPRGSHGDFWLPSDSHTLFWFDGSQWIPVGPADPADFR